jgi:RHS repeat-associated protein
LITTYTYDGFRFDLWNSIALGFARIEHTDQAEDTPDFSVSHRTRFRQESHLVGHPRLEQTIINQGSQSIVVDEITKSWDEHHVNVTLNGAAAPGFLQILLSKSVSKTFDLSGTGNIVSNIETTFTYDDWLNANTVQVSKPGRATQTLVNQYVGTDYARYGRLTTSTSSVTDSTGTKVNERTSTFTYFDVGVPQRFLLKTEAIDVGDDQLNSRTTYTRDDRGNIASTTKTAVNALRRLRSNPSATHAGGSSRTNGVQYDADLLRQVIHRTDAKRHDTELEYPPDSIGSNLSLPTRSIDPNQLISTQTYDGLGRTVTLSTPDRVTHHFYRYLSAQIPAEWLAGINAISSVVVPSQNPPRLCPSTGRTLTWTQQQIGFAEEERLIASNGASRLLSAKIYDTGKRVIRSITVRTDGTHTLLAFADSKYDTQGRLVAHSLPYFAGKTPYWTAYDYDPLDRRTLTVRPNGAISRLCYSVTAWGLQETLVDARNDATVVQLNLDGKPLTITRPDKGHVDLSYDAMGRVNAVRSPSGAMTTLDFDGLGNRRLVKDPNAGTVEYSYDAFGQLREQRSGSQQPIELDYDELGRKTWEGRYDQETTWTFDKRGAIGQLDTITLTSQNSPTILTYVESYHYDRYARLSRTLTKLDATASSRAYETHFSGAYAFSYDPYSVLDGVVYPTSISNSGPLLQIKRQYNDATGQLTEVDDVSNGNRHYLWRLQSANASGHTQRASFGNGTRETKTFDPSTDRIKSFSVADSTGKSLLTEGYSYDPVGNLLSRLSDGHDLEQFKYDEQNRLNSVERSRKTVSVTYDSDDRIRTKSDVGEYHYFGDTDYAKYCHSSGNSAPDAVCAIQRDEETTDTFEYDEVGDIRNHDSPAELGRRSTAVDYTSDHHVATLSVRSTFGGPATAQFFYGPAGQRILSREKNDGRYKETVHMGLYDRISVKRSTTLALVTDRFYVLGDQGVFLTVDATNTRHTSSAGSPGLHTTVLYQHHDRLGSIVLLTKNDGHIGARIHYDPWGKASGGLHPSEDDNSHLDIAAAWTRGFDGQDHIPDFDLIHMTGRVYDPRLGIFLSVDVLGGQAQTGGDLNPYLYAEGNPLAIVDPTGFCGWSDPGSCLSGIGQAIGSVGQAISNVVNSVANTVSSALQNAAQWVSQNWREVATVAVIAVVTFATAGTGTGPVVAATLAGAAGGATEAALYGGSVQDVIGAAIEGAVFGGFSAGLANAGLSWEASEFAHGFVGGFQSAMSGQDFAHGFLIGALSQVSGSSIAVSYTSGWSVAEQVAVSAVVNGAVSEAQGDKFANGALTGVFQQLYLDADQGQWQIKSVIEAANILVSSNQPQFGVGGIVGAVGVIQQSLNMTTNHFVSGYSEVGSFLNILQTGANDLTELETAVEALKSKPPAPGMFSPGFAF